MEEYCPKPMDSHNNHEEGDTVDESEHGSTGSVDVKEIEQVRYNKDMVGDTDEPHSNESDVSDTDMECVVNESTKHEDFEPDLKFEPETLDLDSLEADLQDKKDFQYESPDSIDDVQGSTSDEDGSVSIEDQANPTQDIADHDSTVCVSAKDTLVSFIMFISNIATCLTPQNVEQINFILKDHYKDAMTSTPKTGYEVLELLRERGDLNKHNVLWLQVISAVIHNDQLIHDVFHWAKNQDDVLYFDPPVKCSYNWRYDGPLHVKGERFDLYSETEIEEIIERIHNLLQNAKVVNGRPEKTYVRGELHDVSYPPCCIGNINNFQNNSELNICPDYNGFKHEENTIPKRVYAEEPLAAFTHENNRLRESDRQQNQLKFKPDELTQKLNVSQSEKRADQEKLVSANETINQLKQYIRDLQAEKLAEAEKLASANETIDHQKKDIGDLQAEILAGAENLASAKETIDHQKKDIGDLQAKILAGAKYLASANETIDHQKKDIGDLQAEILAGAEKLDKANEKNEKLKQECDEFKRNLEDIEMGTYKLQSNVNKLEYELELTEASLSNERNPKQRNELDTKIKTMCDYSLTLRKAYTSFDPASSLPPPTSETFKHSFTYKIGRLYPQIM